MRLSIVYYILFFACGCLSLEIPAAEPCVSASWAISALARVEYSTGLTPIRAMDATLASDRVFAHMPGGATTDSNPTFLFRYLLRLPAAGDVSIIVIRGDVIEYVCYSPTQAISPPELSPGPSEQTLFFDLAADPGAADVIVTVAYLDN